MATTIERAKKFPRKTLIVTKQESSNRSCWMRRAVTNIFPGSSQKFLPKQIPLNAKNNVGEFYINLDEPHKSYRPGDEISGQIILVLSAKTVNLSIDLTLEGSVRTCSNSALRSDKKDQLFSHSIRLYGNSNKNELGLSSGEHRFPFIVKIPKKNIYTSISFEKGEIKYLLRTELSNENNGLQLSSEKLLNIVKPINLTLLPTPEPRVLHFRNNKRSLRATLSSASSLTSFESMDSSGSQGSDTIRVKLSLPAVGYLKGESVPVKLNVKHYKPISNTNGIIITLIRICKIDMGKEYELQSYRKDLSQSVVPLVLDPRTFKCEISTSVKVPLDSFPTIISPSLSFQYFIEVLINMNNRRRPIVSNNQSKLSVTEEDIKKIDFSDKIFNVDNLKRMKNVLTMTNEVVIGTERKVISKINRSRVSNSISDSNSSGSEASSSQLYSAEAFNTGILNSNNLSQHRDLPPLHEQIPINISSLINYNQSLTRNDYDTVTAETATRSTGIHSAASDTTISPHIPQELINTPNFESVNGLTEKEEIRRREEIRERLLLPSEPPINNTPSTVTSRSINLNRGYTIAESDSDLNDQNSFVAAPAYSSSAAMGETILATGNNKQEEQQGENNNSENNNIN